MLFVYVVWQSVFCSTSTTPDFHLYLEAPPITDSERWSGRPFRALSVVHPPSPINFNPRRSEEDKNLFLEKLWTAQAYIRTREDRSVVLYSPDQLLEETKVSKQVARTYFNLYQRTQYLQEPNKVET